MVRNNYEAIGPNIENYQDPRIPDEVAFVFDDGIVEERDLWKVEFASTLNLETLGREPGKVEHLLGLDHVAFLDAQTWPGYEFYFADKASDDGLARSFCIWNSAEEADEASKSDVHMEAVRFAMGEGRDVYSYFGLTKTDMKRTETGLFFVKKAFMAFVDGEIVVNWKRQ